MENTQKEVNQSQYLVPASVIVAGLLIAGAVIYIGGTPGNGGPLPQPGAPGAGSPLPEEVAKAIGLNEGDFDECMASGRYAERVQDDQDDAIAAGGAGTPYSVVMAGGRMFPISGAVPLEGPNGMQVAVQAALAGDVATMNIFENQSGGPVGSVRPVGQGDHILGDPNAPVKIIEYSDLECPFCQMFHSTMHALVQESDGQVAWVYRHFPLDSIHPLARPLAEGSECAAELGGNEAFWSYVDYIFR